jgi:hypothetical protein
VDVDLARFPLRILLSSLLNFAVAVPPGKPEPLRIPISRVGSFPRWGDHNIDHVRSVAVEESLDSNKRAKGAKAKFRNIMSAIFHHAMRYEWVDRNPIKKASPDSPKPQTKTDRDP